MDYYMYHEIFSLGNKIMTLQQSESSSLCNWLPPDVIRKYSVYNYNHAAEILSQSFTSELNEIVEALRALTISIDEIRQAGGNESPIPPKFSAVLEPKGWREIRISGDLLIKFFPRRGTKKGSFSNEPYDEKILENYIDGHNIDFVKRRVAVDVEWNSKDQTFDRDLFAMRTYYECDIISVGVIITRDESLNVIFKKFGLLSKYGASTTWMGKLLPRLNSRRHGGCPILAIGIKPDIVSGDEMDEK